MANADRFASFMESFKTKRTIAEPIASDTWTVDDPKRKGRKRTVRIEIGKPRKVPKRANGDWFCPVFVEGYTPHVIPAMGVGPIDSLLNAITVLRGFAETIAYMHIDMTAASSKARTRRKR